MKIDWKNAAIHWHKLSDDESLNPYDQYWYYFCWWHWLPKDVRYFGYDTLYHDCQVHEHFGFWFFNVGWSIRSSIDRMA